MVAGALRNPWAATGRILRFGEDAWDGRDPSGEWDEHEIVAGASPVFRHLFAGKDAPESDAGDEGEFLYVEEVLAPSRPAPKAKEAGMPKVQPDTGEVSFEENLAVPF